MATPVTKSINQAQVELTAKFFRGLGDPNRLEILAHLSTQPRTVSELVALLGVPQGRVSNHLACLRWCGFVKATRQGRFLYYQIADSRVKDLIELAKAVMAANAEHIYSCTRIKP
jgi:DNA-binding transcriptional ArsR family regulator